MRLEDVVEEDEEKRSKELFSEEELLYGFLPHCITDTSE
jgi:hypothetical protein